MLSLGQDGAARNAHQYIFNYIHYWNDTEIAVFGEIYLYFDLLKADLTVGGTSYSFLVVGLEPDRVPVDYFMNKNSTVKENIERYLQNWTSRMECNLSRMECKLSGIEC